MGISESIIFPKTSKDFEQWCKWVARNKYGPDVFLYERKDQHGIDIYWTSESKYHVVQSKLREKPDASELISQLEHDFERAFNQFGDKLSRFVFAATISLTAATEKIKRKSGEESLLDVCLRLESKYLVKVDCWHWNHIVDEISGSPYLNWHLLRREQSAEYINTDFFERERSKIIGTADELKLDFYGGIDQVQWYGVIGGWDAPRQSYAEIEGCIEHSFQKKYAHPVCAVIRGEGGSGKSVLLRRLAFDLHNRYTIYWLSANADKFLVNELRNDIEKFPEHQFLVIMEDWYRNIEYAKQFGVGLELLKEISRLSNTRILIGDRPGISKLYDEKVARADIYDLLPGENRVLLSKIFEQMPAWKNILTEQELTDASHSSLFIILFVFCYGERPGDGDLSDRYHRIFKSDYKKLISRNEPFWRGVAQSLYVYGNLYSTYGFKITLVGLLTLAVTFGDCELPKQFKIEDKVVLNAPVLKKYVHLDSIVSKIEGEINRVVFHHDTMAESGWSTLLDMDGVLFDDLLLKNIDAIFRQYDLFLDVDNLKYRQISYEGERSIEKAREFLASENPHKYRNTFNLSLYLLKGEEIAKMPARKFLETDHPEKNYGAFCHSLEILRGEEISKVAARKFLETDCPYSIREAFCTSLEILKGEEISKVAARRFLGTDCPYNIRAAFCSSLEILKGEEISKVAARKFLGTDCPFNIREAFCTSLEILKGEEISKVAARKFLGTDYPYKIEQAFCISLKVLKGEEISKVVAGNFLRTDRPDKNYHAFCTSLEILKGEEVSKVAARNFLGTDHPEKNQGAFCTSLEILKGEEVSKVAARNFLGTDHPEKNQGAFCTSLRVLDVEAIDIATSVLRSIDQYPWGITYNCLCIVGLIEECYPLVESVVQTIIKERDDSAASKNSYVQLLKIPLFNIPKWQQEVKGYIENWERSNRNVLYSITISYKDCPDGIMSMCIGVIRNWRKELSIKRKYDGYFSRCLAHPVIIQKRSLRKEVKEICKEIQVAHKLGTVFLNPNLQALIAGIVEKDEYSNWRFEKDI